MQRKAEQEQKAQQRQAAALATDEAALAKMSKKDVVELIQGTGQYHGTIKLVDEIQALLSMDPY